MRRGELGELSGDLLRTRQRFEAWRAGRNPGDRIPARLWNQAVKLAGKHGVSRTATALKLDYYALKKRLAQSRVSVESTSPETAFVELPSPISMPMACEYSVELEDGRGASMRVTVKGGGLPDLIALGRSFWNAE